MGSEEEKNLAYEDWNDRMALKSTSNLSDFPPLCSTSKVDLTSGMNS